MLKKYISVFMFFIAPLALFAQAPKKMPLDGQVYTVEVLQEGKKKPVDPYELKFTAGKFKSMHFDHWGFGKSAPYVIVSVDSTAAGTKIYSWTAEVINDIKEKMSWTGTITGEEIEGTSLLTDKKGPTKYKYSFTGTLKKKPGKKK